MEVCEVIHGKVGLNPVHRLCERSTKHGRIQYQNVEREVAFLERDCKLSDTVQRTQV